MPAGWSMDGCRYVPRSAESFAFRLESGEERREVSPGRHESWHGFRFAGARDATVITRYPHITGAAVVLFTLLTASAGAWHDETHLAVAKAAGYEKWYNAAGPDMAKLKAGEIEQHNHYVNNPPETTVTPKMVMAQVHRYNTVDPTGHLYGAIIAAIRNYVAAKATGKYGEYHLAFAAHYLADLSMPLHNVPYDDFNKKNHAAMDGIVNADILDHLERIRIYPVTVRSEGDLAKEIARVANLSIALGRKLATEDRLPTVEEAYQQLGHSASVLRAVLEWTGAPRLEPGEAEEDTRGSPRCSRSRK
jgi:hypothetical protein